VTATADAAGRRNGQAVSDDALQRLDALGRERGMPVQREAPLAGLTTLRVGGIADRLVTPRDRDALLASLALARDAGVPCFVLGNGSDIVVADAGIRGLVIRNRARGLEVDGTTLRADSGAAMAQLVKRCIRDALAGLEFGISIPGSLGGAVWANAGAHGGEMRDVVAEVELVETGSGIVRRLAGDACGFAYRESRFKHAPDVILGAALALRRGESAAIGAAVEAHQDQRRATQPLADQNAGSVFRNPPGDFAGRLIEAAGLKTFRHGSARVSELHANFIVTDAGARAADVRALGDAVRATVAARFGVWLEYEIEFVGDWPATTA
jgi:UDP-N-acetylmuramate dehydrogenase